MKTILSALLGIMLVTPLSAQGPADFPPPIKLTPAELDELLGPIALYPDALIALILPASAFPLDVVLGARFIAGDGDLARVDGMAWDSSVKALTRYPDTLQWLDENLEWTTQIGDAFIAQPVEVMESIQLLRAKARALGNLVDTPQQRIILDDVHIRIIPAHPEYIYEPRYDPRVIYVERSSAVPLLFFSVAWRIGSWLNYDFDWHQHRLYRGDWHEGWDYSRDRNRNRGDQQNSFRINNNLTNSREWRADPERRRMQTQTAPGRTAPFGTSLNRGSSNGPGVSQRQDRPKGIARPKPNTSSARRGETIRKAEQPGSRNPENQPPSAQKPKSNPQGNSPKGPSDKPKSAAPGIKDDGKRGGAPSDNKSDKPKKPIQEEVRRPNEQPTTQKKMEPKPNDPPSQNKSASKGKSSASTKPKNEAPKQSDPPKSNPPKREEPTKKLPQKSQQMKPKDNPKSEPPKQSKPQAESPKREAPKPKDSPKPEMKKPQPDTSKEKGKDKEDEKDKKDKDKKK